MTWTPTTEQVAALDAFATGDDLVIEAGAGTGKTSTLVLLAASAPDRRGQYVAFNKSIVTEAGSKLPGNVAASTAHSLAFRSVGRNYGARLRNSRRMRSTEIARFLGIDALALTTEYGRKYLSPGYLAGLAMRGVTRYCQTADPVPTRDHVPWVDGIDIPRDAGALRPSANNRVVANHLAPALTKAWADLVALDGALPYRHDHYLKAWQLSSPRIGADFILFDEAQDANPVMQAVVLAQRHAQLVWVGDSQQQIYGFTGAVNAMAEVGSSGNRVFLSQSFRFGSAIADVANHVLGDLGAELRLLGSPAIASTVGSIDSPDAVLCRTNAMAVSEILRFESEGVSAHLVGGGAEVVAFARAADDLMEGRSTVHPELACFDTWAEVQDYVEYDEQGGELRLLVGLVDEFGVGVILGALERMPSEFDAAVVISTAHKAKGREWDRVALAADFPDPEKDDVNVDELRLLYVAVTRARLELDVDACPLLAGPETVPEPPLPLG